MSYQALFESLWQDFTQRLCPSAKHIHRLLAENDSVTNDHIALRTFDVNPTGLATLAKPFEQLGYRACADYYFKQKKLRAKHYEHRDPQAPKVFISELMLEEFSTEFQQIVTELISSVDSGYFEESSFLFSGRPWELTYAQYQSLNQESEYAAWVAAHGYGANHFTVDVNRLSQFTEIEQVNRCLTQHGYQINGSGGEVKGCPEVFLQQSSTMADKVEVILSDQMVHLPGGFYEFAKRYPMANGKLYSGFVEASADKIFESTNQ